MNAILFHNPTAGDGNHSREMLLPLLRDGGLSATYCSTKGKHFPEMLRERAELFVVAGGDGTVGKVLRKMPDRSIPVAILPLGTANNIAHSLGVAGEEPIDTISGLQTARKQRFDIGMARGPWGHQPFVEAVGLGSLAKSMMRMESAESAKTESGDELGLAREKFRKVLGEAKPIRFDISVDGRTFVAELLLIEVLNVTYAGPRLALAPQGGLGDGLFDIITIGPDQRANVLDWLGAPEPMGPPPVTRQQGAKIRLTWEDPPPLRLDDDWPSGAKHHDGISVQFEGDPITILVPERPENKPGRSGTTR
jgi:diacylglycerol kinase family enzyme